MYIATGLFDKFSHMTATSSRRTLLVLLLTLSISGVIHPASNDEPILTTWMVDQIKALPNGLNEDALLIRSKHVEAVEFFGAGQRSRSGFAYQGIAPLATWLQLRNRGEENWASAAIRLREPINVARYNSIVIWVRANLVDQRVSVGLQDPSWKKQTDAQSRTTALPSDGFRRNEIIQVVVPFTSLESDKAFDKRKLNQITFEFGSDTTSNEKLGSLDVFGVAFVKQTPAMKTIQYTVVAPASPAPTVAAVPKKKIAPKPVVEKPVLAEKPAPVKPAPAVSNSVSAPAADMVIAPPKAKRTKKIKNEAPNVPPVVEQPAAPVQEEQPKDNRGLILLLVALIIGSTVTIIALTRRRTPKKLTASFGKTFYEINWTLASAQTTPTLADEKRFWKDVAAEGVTAGWMSPFQATADQLVAKEEYFAETFLKRQIELARESGVRLFPSLCFARTVFQYETFLSNPRIYSFKHVAPSDRHFSDQELRTKNIGYFPVWIPPFWQRQHALPERVLVAYGKLPGVSQSSDSVQFLLTSPELRKYAIDTIERFASVTNGVRIQGAAAMLNTALTRFWHIPLTEQQRTKAGEFWAEVIRAVRIKHPHFVFVADHAGSDAKLLRDLGFDFFENDHLLETLTNQIRLESVGNLATQLSPPHSSLLERSIHDLSPLLGAAVPANANERNNLLGSLILSLLPGAIQHDGSVSGAFGKFLKTLSTTPLFRNGNFLLLPTDSPGVLAFARWDQRTLYVAVANLSSQSLTASVNIQPFLSGFTPNAMYLFNDVLHGTSYLKDLPTESSGEPALAVMGQDVHDSGLPVIMTARSLRLFSVNMKRPIRNETSAKIRQLHKA